MTDEAFAVLVESCLDETITSADRRALTELVLADERWRDRFESQARLHVQLHATLREESREFAEQTLHHILAGLSENRQQVLLAGVQQQLGLATPRRPARPATGWARWAALAAMIMLALGSLWMRPWQRTANPEVGFAQFETVQGEVYVSGTEGKIRAQPGMAVLSGQRVETVGAGSSAVVNLADRGRLELGEETSMTSLGSSPLGLEVVVERGVVYSDAVRDKRDAPLAIRTPHGRAEVGQSRLLVSVEPASTLWQVQQGASARVSDHRDEGAVDLPPGRTALADDLALVAAASPPGEVLLLVGHPARNAQLRAGDAAVRARLEMLGLRVTERWDKELQNGDLFDKSLIVVTGSVGAGSFPQMFQKLRVKHTGIPLIAWDAKVFKELGMTGEGDGGRERDQTALVINSPQHPLAGGLAGDVEVLSRVAAKPKCDLVWGRPLDGAVTVATVAGQPDKAAVFAYEVGVPLRSLAAPARRVGLFLHPDSITQLKPDGWTLFDAAVRWCIPAAKKGSL